jgi:hypothetical protein
MLVNATQRLSNGRNGLSRSPHLGETIIRKWLALFAAMLCLNNRRLQGAMCFHAISP